MSDNLLNVFHGTDNIAGEKIIKSGFKIIKLRNDHWLGQGVYFFEDRTLSEWWAQDKCEYKNNNKSIQINKYQPFIIQATINTDKICNLDDRDKTDLYNNFINNQGKELIKNKFKGINFENKEKNKKIIECLLFDLFSKKYGYNILKMTFIKSNPSYKNCEKIIPFNNCYLEYKEVQICVKELSAIKEVIKL